MFIFEISKLKALFVLIIFEIILANVEAVPMMKVEKVKEEK